MINRRVRNEILVSFGPDGRCFDEVPEGKERHTCGGTIVRKDGRVFYEGTLGSFSYDPKEYVLCVCHLVSDDPLFGMTMQFPVLKYIGEHPDDAVIPSGLLYGNYLFSGNETMKRAHVLPEGMKTALQMYALCPSLEEIEDPEHFFPESLEDASYMFLGCERLRIDTLKMRLPAGLTHRAAGVV